MADRTGLCLSIRQPWAWLIVRPDIVDPDERRAAWESGIIKPLENRDWPTRVRGWIGIHAAMKFDRDGYAWVRDEFPQITMPKPREFECGGIIGRARLVDCVTYHDSGWFCGLHGFVFDATEPLPFRQCRGMLGFFKPDLRVLHALQAAEVPAC